MVHASCFWPASASSQSVQSRRPCCITLSAVASMHWCAMNWPVLSMLLQGAFRLVLRINWFLFVHHLMFCTFLVLAFQSQSLFVIKVDLIVSCFATYEFMPYAALIAQRVGALKSACPACHRTQLLLTDTSCSACHPDWPFCAVLWTNASIWQDHCTVLGVSVYVCSVGCITKLHICDLSRHLEQHCWLQKAKAAAHPSNPRLCQIWRHSLLSLPPGATRVAVTVVICVALQLAVDSVKHALQCQQTLQALGAKIMVVVIHIWIYMSKLGWSLAIEHSEAFAMKTSASNMLQRCILHFSCSCERWPA